MTRQDDIKTLIINHSRRLQKLKERQASEGVKVDPAVVTEIEDIEATIKKLRQELETLPGKLLSSPRINILVVDDVADWRNTIANLLTKQGYAVHTAHNGKDALELIADEAFDCAIIDVRLHGDDENDESGLVLAVAIKRFNPQTYVIGTTGSADVDQTTRALRFYNLDWFVAKSDMDTEILKTIERRLKSNRQR